MSLDSERHAARLTDFSTESLLAYTLTKRQIEMDGQGLRFPFKRECALHLVEV